MIRATSLPLTCIAALAFATLATIRTAPAAQLTAEPSDRGVVVKIDGQPFAEYLIKAGQSPAVWPIIGPTGKPMTRSFPVGPTLPNDSTDHPHHQSMWFTYDKVNGVGFWAANTNQPKGDEQVGIVHREFAAIESPGSTVRIVARNDWMNGEQRVCTDQRTLVFGTESNGDRWIDCTITIKASDGDVEFGDTKEGAFSVRVADTMKVDAKLGGHIVNSEGLTNSEAWGMPAKWVDYTGPVDGETVGIAMLSHPSSFRPVPRWHVRTYGLFAANPFGEHDFPKCDTPQDPVTIKKGDELTLRYRVLFHRGDTETAHVADVFRAFAASR